MYDVIVQLNVYSRPTKALWGQATTKDGRVYIFKAEVATLIEPHHPWSHHHVLTTILAAPRS
jgi:hypothetical protein